MEKGEKFGMLTAIKFSRKTPDRKYYWIFRCECGNEKEIRADCVKRDVHKSCGCYNGKQNEKFIIHNKSKTRTYKSWQMMKVRCYNTSYDGYKNYGGRGITVCGRWLKSFENFVEDMGDRPNNRTLDRINNDGNYEPENCRWATIEEQLGNRRPYGSNIVSV